MKRRLSSLARVVLGGLGALWQLSCTPPLDLCADAAGACLTVQVTADNTDPVDLLRALYTVSPDGRKEMQFMSPPGGSPLPAGFALNLTTAGTVDLAVIAERSLRPTLRGSAQVTVGEGEHQQVTVELIGDLSGLPYVGPAPRHHAGMAYFPARNAVVLFGGIGSDGAYLNDTWELDVASGTWSSPPEAAAGPSPRTATLAYFAGATSRLILASGTGANGLATQDLWAYDGKATWTPSPAIVHGGGTRVDAAMTVTDGGFVIVAGGIDPGGTILQDIVTYDLAGATKGSDFIPHLPVNALPPIKTPKLVSLTPSAMMAVGSEVFLLGTNEANPGSALGVYQIAGTFATTAPALTVTALATTDPPSRRTDFAVAADSAAGLIYVFGGTAPTGEPLQDAYVLNVLTKQWAKVSTTAAPLARAGAQLALLPPGVLLLGGLNSLPGSVPQITLDTWKLTTDPFDAPTLPGVFVRRP